jgi:thiamine-monophosphate kinase
MTTLRDIGEDALIQRLIDLVPRDKNPSAGPGDDCAVIDQDPSSPTLLLLKTDALVSSIHFLPDAPSRAVGWKAAARVVSDFAAMGGYPEHFLITLALPSDTLVMWVEDLYRGFGDCLSKFGGTLAGGETSGVPAGSAAVISIAATGRVHRDHLVLRSTAKPGDLLFVTGTLGGSITGKHLNFTPRLEETSWLVANHKPTAMMDLSDGLAKDLPRLADASQCGFHLDESSLPLNSGCSIAQGLGDGEDYEMLFSIDPSNVSGLITSWQLRFPGLPLTRIGVIADKSNRDTMSGGWEHFPRSE